MSNPPRKSEPPSAGASAGTRARPKLAPIVGSGLVAFAIVFSGFLIYLAAAPTTYRTTALLKVEYAPEAAKGQPEPLEAARRLREAALDRELLAKLAREESKTETAEAWAAAASRIRGAFEVDSLDGKTFAISFRDAEAARTERVCNQLADRVVSRAPDALLSAGRSQEAAAEHDRDVDQVTAFLSKHPEVAREPGVARDQAADPAHDQVLRDLKSERAVIDAQLAAAAAAPKASNSDNPYGEEPKAPIARLDSETLRRRLNEINGAINSRQKALSAAAPSASAVAPDVAAEWRRLLQKAKSSEVASADKPQAPLVKAEVARRAPFPDSPIEPNRGRLLTFATFVSTIVGLVFALLRSVTPARSRRSSPKRARSDEGTRTERSSSPVNGAGRNAPSDPPRAALAYAPTARDLALHPPVPAAPMPVAMLPAAAPDAVIPRRAIIEVTASSASGEHEQARSASSSPPAAGRATSSAPPVAASSAPPAAAKADVEPAPTTLPLRTKVTRTTQVLGSPLPAEFLEPPGRAPDGLSPARASATPAARDTTGYSYVSSDALPAQGTGSDAPRPAEAAPAAERAPSNGAPAAQAAPPAVTLTIHDAPPNWSPDAGLAPGAQHALIDQVLRRANGGSVVVGFSGPPGASDAKARVAAELALGLAETRRARVLLMEGNLQRPAVHRYTRVTMPLAAGLSLQLNARADRSILRPWAVLQCTPNLHVLAEGVMRSPGLLLSQAFYECVKELRTCYDVVVIDGPSMSDAVECRAFDSLVDTLVLVAQNSLRPELIKAGGTFTRPLLSEVLVPG